MKRRTTLLKTIPFLFLSALSLAAPANAQTVPFKVFITELWQLDVGVDPGLGLIGDYYAKITINGVEHSNQGACDDGFSPNGIIVPLRLFKNFDKIPECSAKTPWVFSQQVPVGQTVHVHIQIFDSDTISDDEADLKVGDGNAINLEVNPVNGLWTGDVASPQNCSRPNLNIGGANANVCWQMGFDTDDDGLLDSWERFGVDTDNDRLTDIDLLFLGANFLRKDIFVEADYLQAATHTHAPTKDAIERIVTAFANAPVSNPDGTTGVQLHVDVGPLYGAGARFTVTGAGGVVGTYGDLGGGNGIGEAGNEIIDDFGAGKGPGGTKVEDLTAANFDPLRDLVFRYAIFGHQTNSRLAVNDCTTGVANTDRRQLLVTLGGVKPNGKPCWGTDLNGFSVGFAFQQAGTFMHELGHTLGLSHGGADTINDKPNYLSVMNYTFQACDVPHSAAGLLPGGCDYSRLVLGQVLPTLDERDLDECLGMGGGLGFGKVDWNGNGIFEGLSQCGLIFKNTTADLNNDGVCVASGPNGRLDTTTGVGDDMEKDGGIDDGKNRFCSTTVKAGSDDQQVTAVGDTPRQPDLLKSFDDWSNLSFSLIDFPIASGATSGQEPEPDPTTVEQSRRFIGDLMAPLVTLGQSGPATGKPGDILTYSVKVTNTGRGPALSSSIQETNPDGTVVTSDLDVVSVGSELTRARNFAVPANACPGDFTSAGVSMAFKDFAGQGLTAAATTPLQILDVAPPTFELSLSPDILWPPNHKFIDVTATLAFQDNCDRNPAVTLVSITSNEPADKKDPDVLGAAFGTDDRTFQLRAERDTGHGATGRVYTVTYRVTDNAGNATVKSATVTVPANNGQK